MSKGPRWSLTRIRELVQQDKLWVQNRKALEPVMRVFGGGRLHARETIRAALMLMRASEFVKTVELTWDTADIYCTRYCEMGWYVKVYIDETDDGDEMTVISFHRLERPIKTRGGMVQS